MTRCVTILPSYTATTTQLMLSISIFFLGNEICFFKKRVGKEAQQDQVDVFSQSLMFTGRFLLIVYQKMQQRSRSL